MLSIEELYSNFKGTIEECGSFLLLESDEIIEYKLFEEFSVDAISFLHENTLKLLLDEGKINDSIVQKCMKLRSSYLELEQKPYLFQVTAVKTAAEWKELFDLSDEIKGLLY